MKAMDGDYIPYQNFRVDCSMKDEIVHRLGDNRKRQIKKALNSGVRIREAQSEIEIDAFFSILNDLYKNKIHKPLLPQALFNEFFKSGLCKYLLVIFNDIGL